MGTNGVDIYNIIYIKMYLCDIFNIYNNYIILYNNNNNNNNNVYNSKRTWVQMGLISTILYILKCITWVHYNIYNTVNIILICTHVLSLL